MKRGMFTLLLIMLTAILASQSVFWEETFNDPPFEWALDSNWAISNGILKLSWDPTVTDYDLSAVSPLISLPNNVGNLTVTQFIDEYSAVDEIASIGVIANGNYTEIWQHSLTEGDWGHTGGENLSLPFAEYSGQDIQLKFRSYGSSTWNFDSWNIYNLAINASLNNDLAITEISGNNSIEQNQEGRWIVNLKNQGILEQNSYTVKLFKYGGEEIGAIDVDTPIQAGEEASFEFSWTPTDIENTMLYGEVILENDENLENNRSSYHYLRVHSVNQLNVLILDTDNNAHYVSPETGESVGCERGIQKALGINGINYTTVTSLPEEIYTYDIVFVDLGLWCLSCSATPPGTVSFNDQQILINYLDNGGSVYIEGADVAFNHHNEPFFAYFGTDIIDTGNTDEINVLTGADGTFAEDITCNIFGGSDAHYKIDNLFPTTGTAFFTSDDQKIRAISNETAIYRTICSSVILGSFADGDGLNTKAFIMGQYINYLTRQATSVNENSITPNTIVLGKNYPNPFNPTTTINYNISKQANVKLSIYNLKGEKVRVLVNKILNAGSYKAVWNGKNNAGKIVASGVYLYKLSSENSTQLKRMILMK